MLQLLGRTAGEVRVNAASWPGFCGQYRWNVPKSLAVGESVGRPRLALVIAEAAYTLNYVSKSGLLPRSNT